jgi:hypothetical protein
MSEIPYNIEEIKKVVKEEYGSTERGVITNIKILFTLSLNKE